MTSSACFDEIDFPSGQYIGSPWSCFPPLGRPKISRNDGCRSKSSRWVRSMLMAVSNDGLVAYVFFFLSQVVFFGEFSPKYQVSEKQIEITSNIYFLSAQTCQRRTIPDKCVRTLVLRISLFFAKNLLFWQVHFFLPICRFWTSFCFNSQVSK